MTVDFQKLFRKDNLLILILSGVLLFVIALPVTSSKNRQSPQQKSEPVKNMEDSRDENEAYVSDLEKRLETLIGAMEGVGNAKVMITLDSTEEIVIEKERSLSRDNTTETDNAGGKRVIERLDSKEQTVYRAGESPFVIKTKYPRIRGVVVVASGAGSGNVSKNITDMVEALLEVDAHRVKVVKMSSGR